jgi:cytidylate kinase
MAKRIVTISHTTAAGGDSVGRSVAHQLGFRYIDEQIVEAAAAKHGLDTGLVADAERRTSFLTRFLEEMGRLPALEVSGAGEVNVQVYDLPRRSELRVLIVEAIRETAESGDVVIVSHAAGIPLAGRDDILRVLVTAPFDTRVRRLAAATNVALTEAERRLKEEDAGRADYFRRFYGIEHEHPTHYDLVLNTDKLTPEQATGIVIAAAR